MLVCWPSQLLVPVFLLSGAVGPRTEIFCWSIIGRGLDCWTGRRMSTRHAYIIHASKHPYPMKPPLKLTPEKAIEIEKALLACEPFHNGSWQDAVKDYLVLRWVLGLGPATASEVCEALLVGKFHFARSRTRRSCLATVYRVFRENLWGKEWLVINPRGRRWIRYHPRQYAFKPPGAE